MCSDLAAPTTHRFPRLAYLTGWYPAVSLTFILREVEALRGLGAPVQTCAIRETEAREHRGPAEKEAAASTYYVIRAAKNPAQLLGSVVNALRKPRKLMEVLGLARRTYPGGAKAAMYQAFYTAESIVLAHHLEEQGIEHVHNHFVGASATVAMLACHLADVPYSFTLHGPSDLIEPLQVFLREKIHRSKFVACISNYARSQAMLYSDTEHWHKLRIVHCGVMPEMYDRPAVAKDPDAGTHFVFVGRVAPVKGLRVLIRALGDALKVDPKLKLTIVGDGPEREHLEKLAKPLGDAVHFTGYLSQLEVAEVLSSVDSMVLPSFAEGVPVVLMETLASGKPVIATQVAGVGELVEHGVNGMLVSPGDARGLTDALLAMAKETPARRAEMGAAGRAKVREHFDIRKEAAWLGELFSGVDRGRIRPDIEADG